MSDWLDSKTDVGYGGGNFYTDLKCSVFLAIRYSSVFEGVCMSVWYVQLCVTMRVHVYAFLYVCKHVYACVRMYVYVYVCVRMCMCACARMSK